VSGMADIYGRFARKNLPPLREKLAFVDDGLEILPDMSIVMAPGHTPGHFGQRIALGTEIIYIMVDNFLHPELCHDA
jgi:glyoxylase-like metal-dependent hydrolase (beta-lactamase superfamily II)